MRRVRSRIVTVAATLAVTAAAGVAVAAPASAAVKSNCGPFVCIDTAYQASYVQDITVYTRDGQRGTLRGFVRDYADSVGTSTWVRFNVNRDYPGGGALYVCGALDRAGREIDRICVNLH